MIVHFHFALDPANYIASAACWVMAPKGHGRNELLRQDLAWTEMQKICLWHNDAG